MRNLILPLTFAAAAAAAAACAPSSTPDGTESPTSPAIESLSTAWVTPTPSYQWRIGFNVVNPSVSGQSSCFGRPIAQLVHAGEDWANPAGTAVRAIGAGTVVYAANFNYPGWVVVIRHNLTATEQAALGAGTSTIYSQYGHLTNVLVGVNTQVTAGQQIASVLDQGSNSHVHWEVRKVEAPQLCGFNDPGPGYTNAGTDARTWGYLSPSGSVSALAAAGPATCDNNVPLNGTACNPADVAAQFVCTAPGLPSAQQWTRVACAAGQTCQGNRCQPTSTPACGSGLYCAGSQIPGSAGCTANGQVIFCCPSGQQIVNGACAAPTPPPCGAGLFCALSPMSGAAACMSGSTLAYCCASGHTIVNGACSP